MKFKLMATEDIHSGTGKAPSVYHAEFDAIALPDILQELTQFLRGCGFYLESLDAEVPCSRCGNEYP